LLTKKPLIIFCLECGYKVCEDYLKSPKVATECPFCSSTNIRKPKKDFYFENDDC